MRSATVPSFWAAYRTLDEADAVTWFWVGDHDAYMRFFS